MWMLKLPEGAEWLWIKGPIVQVGRAPEAGISVATDKSISRLHVQLEVDHASPGGDLLIRDLGSRFGSTLDGVRIAPNADHRVAASHGARPVELVIGGASYTMLLKFVSMSFCLTRMDKKQKEVLKRAAQLLGADIVDAVEECSHVICPRLTATLKVLTAIVLRKPILSLEWLDFALATSPVVAIPNVNDYRPPSGDDVSIQEPEAPRSKLFSQFCIVLVDQKDEQYRIVLEASGAAVLNMWEDILQLPFTEAVSRTAGAIGATRRQPCIFFDENHGAEAEPEVLALLCTATKLPVRWITAAQVARAIVLCNSPDLPSNTPRCRHSQADSHYLSQLRQSSSQLWAAEPSQSCAVESPKKRARIEPPQGSVPSSDALFMDASSPVPSARSVIDDVTSSFPSPGFVPFKPQPAPSPRKRAAKEVVDDWDSEPVPKRSFAPALPNPLEGSKAAVSSVGRATEMAPMPMPVPVSVPVPIASNPFASPSPVRTGNVTGLAAPKSVSFDDIAPSNDRAESPSKIRVAAVLQKQAQARIEGDECTTKPIHEFLPAPSISLRHPSLKEPLHNQSDSLSSDNVESAEAKDASSSPPSSLLQNCSPAFSSSQATLHKLLEGEWLEVQRQVQDMNLAKQGNSCVPPTENAEEEGQRIFCPPSVEERSLLARIPSNSGANPSAILQASAPKVSRGGKHFVKNRVAKRSVPPLSLQSMDRVLPQETERDLQLRLEHEALERMEAEARQLMNIGGVAPARPLLKSRV